MKKDQSVNNAESVGSIEELENRIIAMQHLYQTLLADVEELQKFSEKFIGIQSRMAELTNYYHSLWMSDSERICGEKDAFARIYAQLPPDQYGIWAQDTIWNMLEDYHEANMKILKSIVERLA